MNLINLTWLYGVDAIFKDVPFPKDIERDVCINTILDISGELEPLYPELELLNAKIINLFSKNQHKYERMIQSLFDEYEIFYNTNRYEETTETRDGANAERPSVTVENRVSAFDSSEYQPSDQTTTRGNSDSEYEENYTRTNHVYGSIGVITSADLARKEILLHQEFNIYDIIAEDFRDSLMLSVL